jgi:hypothetical protein
MVSVHRWQKVVFQGFKPTRSQMMSFIVSPEWSVIAITESREPKTVD